MRDNILGRPFDEEEKKAYEWGRSSYRPDLPIGKADRPGKKQYKLIVPWCMGWEDEKMERSINGSI